MLIWKRTHLENLQKVGLNERKILNRILVLKSFCLTPETRVQTAVHSIKRAALLSLLAKIHISIEFTQMSIVDEKWM